MTKPLSTNFQCDTSAPSAAIALGYAGLIPFLVLPFAPHLAFLPAHANTAFITYSAVILSFLGGIRWGVCATASTPSGRDLWLGIGVSLAGWAACLMTPFVAVTALLAVHIGTLMIDQMMPPRGQMPWLTALRLRLSAGAILAHAVMLAVGPW